MARLTSIFLLIVFLVHIGGYYFISITWRQSARASTAKRIENENYTKDETVTFKVPLTLPYASTYGRFETAKGDFQHEGEFYKLVKQKLQNDTLFVVAIKDVKEKRIFHYMSDFVKASSNAQTSPTGIKLLSLFSKDYVSGILMEVISNPGWSYDLSFPNIELQLVCQDLAIFSPPPDQLI